MKKINVTFFSVIILSLFSSAVSAQQGNFTVNFKGKIIESPCSVVKQVQTVDFGNVEKKDIGSDRTRIPFELQLENCPLGLDTVKMVRPELTIENKEEVGNAKGISIELLAPGAGDGARKHQYAVQNGQLTVPLISQLVLNNRQKAEAGKIDATALFTLEYL